MMQKRYTARDVRKTFWLWDKRALSEKDARAIAQAWSKDADRTAKLLAQYRSAPFFRKLPLRLRYMGAVKRPISKIVFLLSDEAPRQAEAAPA